MHNFESSRPSDSTTGTPALLPAHNRIQADTLTLTWVVVVVECIHPHNIQLIFDGQAHKGYKWLSVCYFTHLTHCTCRDKHDARLPPVRFPKYRPNVAQHGDGRDWAPVPHLTCSNVRSSALTKAAGGEYSKLVTCHFFCVWLSSLVHCHTLVYDWA